MILDPHRDPDADRPGSTIAGCLFCAAIMLSLVLFYFAIKFVDRCCQREAPDFSPPAASSEGEDK